MGASDHVLKFQHTDALGSPVATTDGDRNVLERGEYAPFGTLLNRSISDGPGYTGHVMDAATGLTYMQQRYYDPAIGRFLSVDPVTANSGTGVNFNRYWYANNNPYKFTDPDGRWGRRRDPGASYIGSSINGVDVNSAESIGMANIPKSWQQSTPKGNVVVGSTKKVRQKGEAGESKPVSVPAELPSQDKWALSRLLGVPIEAIDDVQILTNSPKSKLYGAVATTGPNVVFVAGDAESFMADPRTMLEEYYHVVKQWNPGSLTIGSYLMENVASGGYDNNRFEVEAKDFARTNLQQFEYLRTP
ncbi:MAG TPA: RHS repeat-associated core domain-containing protein [Lysobacter sp.]